MVDELKKRKVTWGYIPPAVVVFAVLYSCALHVFGGGQTQEPMPFAVTAHMRHFKLSTHGGDRGLPDIPLRNRHTHKRNTTAAQQIVASGCSFLRCIRKIKGVGGSHFRVFLSSDVSHELSVTCYTESFAYFAPIHEIGEDALTTSQQN